MPAPLRQHHAAAEHDDAQARCSAARSASASQSRASSARYPVPGLAILGEDLVAAIAVIAAARRGDQQPRALRQIAERVDQRARPDHPAVTQHASCAPSFQRFVADRPRRSGSRPRRRRANAVRGRRSRASRPTRAASAAGSSCAPRTVSRTSAATGIPSRAQAAASAAPIRPVRAGDDDPLLHQDRIPSIFAARMKSFSDNPPTACVHRVTSTRL